MPPSAMTGGCAAETNSGGFDPIAVVLESKVGRIIDFRGASRIMPINRGGLAEYSRIMPSFRFPWENDYLPVAGISERWKWWKIRIFHGMHMRIMRICAHIHICTYICIYPDIKPPRHAYTSVYVYAYANACAHTYACVCACAYMCVHAYGYMYVFIHMCIYTYFKDDKKTFLKNHGF